eukprot:Sspe_Gene.40537::Locus_19589_Transcript_1_1_Confidence_1.000_Length_2499::g.40537::m.40537
MASPQHPKNPFKPARPNVVEASRSNRIFLRSPTTSATTPKKTQNPLTVPVKEPTSVQSCYGSHSSGGTEGRHPSDPPSPRSAVSDPNTATPKYNTSPTRSLGASLHSSGGKSPGLRSFHLPSGRGVVASPVATGSPKSPSGTLPTPAKPPAKNVFRWKRGKYLGRGASGEVHLGLNQATGQLMAVKTIQFDTKDAGVQRKLQALQQEIKVMKDFEHENIVGYLFTERIGCSINIFMEFVPGGSIWKLLEEFGPFYENTVRNYTRQIVGALNFLHNHGVIHRDVKGANVLVSVGGLCKLADFGTAVYLKDVTIHTDTDLLGTPNWMAPEVITNKGYGKPCDIWSLGATVIEMLSAKYPFSHLSTAQYKIMNIIGNGEAKIPSDLPASSECIDFINRCLQYQQLDRPTAEEILNDQFLLEDDLDDDGFDDDYEDEVMTEHDVSAAGSIRPSSEVGHYILGPRASSAMSAATNTQKRNSPLPFMKGFIGALVEPTATDSLRSASRSSSAHSRRDSVATSYLDTRKDKQGAHCDSSSEYSQHDSRHDEEGSPKGSPVTVKPPGLTPVQSDWKLGNSGMGSPPRKTHSMAGSYGERSPSWANMRAADDLNDDMDVDVIQDFDREQRFRGSMTSTSLPSPSSRVAWKNKAPKKLKAEQSFSSMISAASSRSRRSRHPASEHGGRVVARPLDSLIEPSHPGDEFEAKVQRLLWGSCLSLIHVAPEWDLVSDYQTTVSNCYKEEDIVSAIARSIKESSTTVREADIGGWEEEIIANEDEVEQEIVELRPSLMERVGSHWRSILIGTLLAIVIVLVTLIILI